MDAITPYDIVFHFSLFDWNGIVCSQMSNIWIGNSFQIRLNFYFAITWYDIVFYFSYWHSMTKIVLCIHKSRMLESKILFKFSCCFIYIRQSDDNLFVRTVNKRLYQNRLESQTVTVYEHMGIRLTCATDAESFGNL